MSFGNWGLATKMRWKAIHLQTKKIRYAYLQIVWKLTQDNTHDHIYTDEAWVNTHHTNEHTWVHSDGKVGEVSSGKGQRLIAVLAGWVEAGVEGAGLVFRSKTNSVGYHYKLNREHYVEWLIFQP